MRRVFWISIAAGGIALVVVPALQWTSGTLTASLLERDDGLGHPAWVVEGGVVAWRPMSGVERATVAVLSMGTAMNEDWVQGRLVTEADPDTFRALSRDYGVDAQAVWHEGVRLDGADPGSFRLAGYGFALDQAAIWRQELRLMLNPAPPEAELVSFSTEVFALDGRAYWLAEPLPELPEGAVEPFCRDFYQMNGALWLGPDRLSPLDKAAFEVSCDSSVPTRYQDGIGQEDITANNGLFYADGPALFVAWLDGSVTEIARFDAPVTLVEEVGWTIDPVSLVQLGDGTVLLGDLADAARMQALGTYPPLDPRAATDRVGEVRLGDMLYRLRSAEDRAPGHYADEVVAPVEIGNYTLSEGVIYSWGEPVAMPGDLPLRLLNPDTLLVGTMCLSYGRYLTDVPPDLDPADVFTACDVHRPSDRLAYDGLRIGFQPGNAVLGFNPNGLNEVRLGWVQVENTGTAPRIVPEEFVASIRFMVTTEGRPFEAEVTRPAPGPEGYRLAPDETLTWPVLVQSPNPRPSLGYRLDLTHPPDRARVLGQAPLEFGHGYLDDF